MASAQFTQPPFTSECDLLETETGRSTSVEDCGKHGGAAWNFVPVRDLEMTHLPPEWRTHQLFKTVLFFCDSTVKIVVDRTSVKRPATFPDSSAAYPFSAANNSLRSIRCGTGFIDYSFKYSPNGVPLVEEGACPCIRCKGGDHPKTRYMILYVVTATHVIYDDLEASFSVFQCRFDSDSDSQEGVMTFYGLSVMDNEDGDSETERCRTDRSIIKCVTHDGELMEWLQELKCRSYSIPRLPSSKHGLVISHPHGLSKKVSVGEILHTTTPLHSLYPCEVPHEFDKDDKCRLPKSDLDIDDEEHLHSVKSDRLFDPDVAMERGVEYMLPARMAFVLPQHAQYFYRIRHPRPCGPIFVTFPPGTRFTFLPDKEKYFLLPQNTEFHLRKFWDKFNKICPHSYRDYRVDTCPGSSGGPVIYQYKCNCVYHLTHSGVLQDGTKRSGLVVI